jgi:hypothetical protein
MMETIGETSAGAEKEQSISVGACLRSLFEKVKCSHGSRNIQFVRAPDSLLSIPCSSLELCGGGENFQL